MMGSLDSVLASDFYNAVPLTVGANLGEPTGPGPLLIPAIIPAYVHMLKCSNQVGMNGYACIFHQVPAGWKKRVAFLLML
jgi:hypothetical protein